MNNYLASLGILIVFISGCESFNSKDVPQQPRITLEYAVNDIIKEMSAEDLQRIKTTKPEGLYQYHHGWGTGIRNHYGMWKEDSELVLDICGKGCHPDDASMFVIRGVLNKLNGYAIRSEEHLKVRAIITVYDDEPEEKNP